MGQVLACSMIKILGCLILFFCWAGVHCNTAVRAEQRSVEDSQPPIVDSLSFPPMSATVLRGCCSYHGGIEGCEANRMRCVDGSLSPRCMCVYDATTHSFWLGKTILSVQAIPSVFSEKIAPRPCPSELLSIPPQPEQSVTVP